MTDVPDNIVLVQLRRLDEKLDRVLVDLGDIKHRLTSVEQQVAFLQQQTGLLHGDFAGQSARIDRVDQRLERIERRLDLVSVVQPEAR
jgi:tetrahydromethanopterin S-methyltransferase subunit G